MLPYSEQVASFTFSEEVRTLQRSLAKEGYRPGPIDGILGDRTLAAAKEAGYFNNIQRPSDIELDDIEKAIEHIAKAQPKGREAFGNARFGMTVRELQAVKRLESRPDMVHVIKHKVTDKEIVTSADFDEVLSRWGFFGNERGSEWYLFQEGQLEIINLKWVWPFKGCFGYTGSYGRFGPASDSQEWRECRKNLDDRAKKFCTEKVDWFLAAIRDEFGEPDQITLNISVREADEFYLQASYRYYKGLTVQASAGIVPFEFSDGYTGSGVRVTQNTVLDCVYDIVIMPLYVGKKYGFPNVQ
jgi:hypothetical protein